MYPSNLEYIFNVIKSSFLSEGEVWTISKKTIVATLVVAVLSIGGASVYLLRDDTSNNRQTIYHTDEDCEVSLSYDSGDGEVHVTDVTGRNIKDILIDGMQNLGSELTFHNDGSIKNIDGKVADDGKVWAIWKWDVEWEIIESIYNPNEKIGLKERAAFGISMANKYPTSPQGYTNPGFYVKVKGPGSDEVQRVFSATPKAIFIEAMENTSHDVQESDGNIIVDGTKMTDTEGYTLLFQYFEDEWVIDPITGRFTGETIRVYDWDVVKITDENFVVKDKANIAIVSISGGSYESPELI